MCRLLFNPGISCWYENISIFCQLFQDYSGTYKWLWHSKSSLAQQLKEFPFMMLHTSTTKTARPDSIQDALPCWQHAFVQNLRQSILWWTQDIDCFLLLKVLENATLNLQVLNSTLQSPWVCPVKYRNEPHFCWVFLWFSWQKRD